jgi:hypothetical protein
MGGPACSAVVFLLRRRRRQNQRRKAARARMATPPTTPPAMAPVLEEDFEGDGFEVFWGELEPEEEVGAVMVDTVVPAEGPFETVIVVTTIGSLPPDVDGTELLVALVVLWMGPRVEMVSTVESALYEVGGLMETETTRVAVVDNVDIPRAELVGDREVLEDEGVVVEEVNVPGLDEVDGVVNTTAVVDTVVLSVVDRVVESVVVGGAVVVDEGITTPGGDVVVVEPPLGALIVIAR